MAKVELMVPFRAAEGKADALRHVLHSLIAPTQSDAGMEFYHLYESETPGHFFFHELWASSEALDAHMKTPHLVHAAEVLKDLLSHPLALHRVHRIV